jgi:hypothetical protein
MNAVANPLGAATPSAPKPAAEQDEKTGNNSAFEAELADASASKDSEASAEASSPLPTEPEPTSPDVVAAEAMLDDDPDPRDQDPVAAFSAVPAIQPLPVQALPAPTTGTGPNEQPAAMSAEPSAQPIQPAPEGPDLLDVQELPPSQADAPDTQADMRGSEFQRRQGEGEPQNRSPLSTAAQSFNVEAPELDGMLEPEPVPEPAADLADPPELPTAQLGRLRITIDEDLAVEVSQRSGRIHIAVDGTSQAVEQVQDLGAELAASLEELGFELGGFTQKERDPAEDGNSNASNLDRDTDEHRKERAATGGRLVNRLA